MELNFNFVFVLLICFYFFLLTWLNFKIIPSRTKKVRILSNINLNVDIAGRKDDGDIESIKNCQNSDYKYFVQYVTGNNIIFDKNISDNRAVRNIKI